MFGNRRRYVNGSGEWGNDRKRKKKIISETGR